MGENTENFGFPPVKLMLWTMKGNVPLLYTEGASKNHPGGLKGRRVARKCVTHHANLENPTRCFFHFYKSHCPGSQKHNAFYLKPLVKPTQACWYSQVPLGHNRLANIVSDKQAGIHGFPINHSLRATSATRLYLAGADEQLIMERTGHQSVYSYKRTS